MNFEATSEFEYQNVFTDVTEMSNGNVKDVIL